MYTPRRIPPPSPRAYLTAYDLAVRHGFKGSEDEWLQSLRGETGGPLYPSESALIEDRTLTPGALPFVMSGAGPALYRIRERGPLEAFPEGSALLMLNNGLCAERIDHLPGHDPYRSPFSTPQSVQNEIFRCGMTYYRRQAQLIYGNAFTANNTLAAPGDTPHRNEGGAKRYEIDCSAFAELVTSGVPFEHSRYCEPNAENTRMHDWGFSWPGKERYYCTHEPGQGRMLANDMAAYCRDRGWLFKPRGGNDFSNLQTGDLLFWQGETDEPGYWENIRHVGIFLWKSGYGNIITLDASTSHPAGKMVVRTRVTSTPYAERLVWCARLPYGTERLPVTPRNLLANPEKVNGRVWEGERTAFLAELKLSEPLAPYHCYTVAVKLTQAEGQYPQDICIRFPGTPVTIDRQMRPYTLAPDGVYIFRFFVTDDDCIANRPDGELEAAGYDHSRLLLCAYAYDEQERYLSEGAEQIRTAVEWAEVFEGIWTPDHIHPAPVTEPRLAACETRLAANDARLAEHDAGLAALERRAARYAVLYEHSGGPLNVTFPAPQRDVMILVRLPAGTERPQCSIYFLQGDTVCGQGYCSSSTLSAEGVLFTRCWDEHGMFLSEYVSQNSVSAVNKYAYANRVTPVGAGITGLESTAAFPAGVSITVYGVPMEGGA